MDALVLGIFISFIGMGAFVYGRKSSRLVPLIGGVILMIYPYFVPNTVAMAAIAAGVIVGMILLRDALE